MDRTYRNVKTGETKTLSEAVYRLAGKKNWVLAEEQAPVILIADPVNREMIGDVLEAYINNATPIPTNDLTPSKESLQSAYETFTGEKPDGRWSEKKLIQKIEELKETK